MLVHRARAGGFAVSGFVFGFHAAGRLRGVGGFAVSGKGTLGKLFG
jgi:hypothetical protein